MTLQMYLEYKRLDRIDYRWVNIDAMPSAIPLVILATRDPRLCDTGNANLASDGLPRRLAGLLFLWPGDGWYRDRLETALALAIDTIWTRRRMIEVYANIAPFGDGVFGVKAGARTYLRRDLKTLRLSDAALLVLASQDPAAFATPTVSPDLRRRASRLAVQAATLRRNGDAACVLAGRP